MLARLNDLKKDNAFGFGAGVAGRTWMKRLLTVVILAAGVVAAEFTRPVSCFSIVVSSAAGRRNTRGGYDGKERSHPDRR
jgi:hypothetical protein